MVWYDPRHILDIFEREKIPIVVDGKIYPTFVAIAQRGYWFQSRVLLIPDRWGYFSSGPPLLQAIQAHKVVTTASETFRAVYTAFLLELFVMRSRWRIPIFMATICVLFIISVYVGEVFSNPKRAQDYDWKALSEKMGVV